MFVDLYGKDFCSFCFQGLESCIHLEELSVENNCISKFEGNFKDSLHEPCPYQAVTNCYSFNFPPFLRYTYYGGSYYVVKLSHSILF